MKQKLPKKNFLYKNLDLDEIQKTKNLLNAWTKWSLIRLFFGTFSNKRHLINLFDFQILTSFIFRDLRNSKNKKMFLFNILVFFTLPFFFYSLNQKSIIEKKNFNLLKIQKQNLNEKNNKSVFKSYFNILNKNFDIFLHNFFSLKKEKKLYKNYLLNLNDFYYNKKKENLNLYWWKFLVLEQIVYHWKISEESLSRIKVLLEKKNIDDLKHFFEFYINHKMYENNNWEYYFYSIFSNQLKKNIINTKINKNSIGFEVFYAFCEKLLFEVDFLSKQDYSQIHFNYFDKIYYLNKFCKTIVNKEFLWWNKKIFQNLKYFGESDQKVIKSYFLIKNKGDLYFHNYIEFSTWQLYKNLCLELKQTNSLKSFNTFYKLNNSEFFLRLEDIFSNYLYKFSKYIIYEKKKSKKKITNSFFHKIINKNFDYFFHVNIPLYFDLNNLLFDWITKNFYINNKLFIKSLLINSSLSQLKNFNKILVKKNSNYIITNVFSKQTKKIDHFPKSIYYAFFEILSINEINNHFYSNDFLLNNKKKIIKNFNLKKNKISDNFRLKNLYKTQNYSKKNLSNFSFLLNSTYDIIQQNSSLNKKNNFFLKKTNTLISKVFYLFYFYSYKYQKLNVYFHFISLKKSSKKKNEAFYLYFQNLSTFYKKKWNKNAKYKNQSFILRNKKELLETNFFVLLAKMKYNLQFVQNKKIVNFWNSIKQSNNLVNKCYLQNNNFIKKNLINKNSINWKKVRNKLFIYNIHYKKIIFNKTKMRFFYFSKKVILKTFFMKKQKLNIFKLYFENFQKYQFHFKKLKNLLNFSEIFIKPSNEKLKTNQLCKISNSINNNLVTTFYFTDKEFNVFLIELFASEINNDFLIKFFEKSIYYTIYKDQEILFNSIKNKHLLQTFFEKKQIITFIDFLQNSQLKYNNRFIFHLEKKNSNNFALLYLQLLKILKKNTKNFLSIKKLKPLIKNKNLFIKSKFSNVFFGKNSFIFNELYGFSNFLNLNFFQENKSKFEIFWNDPSFFQNILLKKTDYKELKQKNLQPNLKNIYINSYYKLTFSELLNNLIYTNYKTFEWINQFIFYSNNYKSKKKLEKNYNKTNFNNKKQIKIVKNFKKNKLFQTYSSWFFTLEWWEYNTYIILEIIQEGFFKIKDCFEYVTNKNNKISQKIFKNFWNYNKKFLKTLFFNNSKLKWNLRFFNEVNYKKTPLFNFIWSNSFLINNYNNLHWAIFSLITFILLSYQQFFSILIGSDFIHLWKNFEIIQYLTDPSRGLYFTKLMRRNKAQFNKTENFLIYFLQNLVHYITNIKFYLLTKKNLKKWLNNHKSLDLSRRKRKLLVQSLITHNKITEYGLELYSNQPFFNSYFGYQITNQQGLLYFQYLAEFFEKNLMNTPLNLVNKWIIFAFWQKIFSSQTLWQTQNFNLGFQNIPVPLQFGLSYSKGILLIGPIETGRSYLIKNLAAESYVPLLKISINKLLYNKPDVITESWMNILIESLRRLNLTLDFAKKMSPCIIWIQDIHQLNVNRLTQNVESDPTFLLGILLKYFQTEFVKTKKKNHIIVIGSTHLPKKVDPALISPNRLEKIINIRLFNISQRKKQFPIFLKKKNFQLKKNMFFLNEFGLRTMGYNLRDLATLTNEVLLISITKNKSFVDTQILKLAFHRQIFGLTYTNNKLNLKKIFKILIYKIGKTIIQNILIKSCSVNFLNIGNVLWKKNFYYLSKWYLEPSIDESIIKELTILTHVLGCLAGTAARDSLFLLEQKDENSLPIDKLIENDFTLAFSILESFFSEFPWLEICKNHFVNYKENKIRDFPTKNSLNIMQNGIFAIANKKFIYTQNDLQNKSSMSQQINFNKKKNYEFKNTSWSPRFWRLSFFRSHLFDWIKRPNDFEFSYQFEFSKKKELIFSTNLQKKNNYEQFIEKKKKEQLLYERILPRIRRRNVQELESQFEEILLEEQFEILGFFQLSTQYPMEYQLYNKPRLFIGKRILWDPVGLFFQSRHFVFSRREFFVDEEMLRRLYVTYGARRERERSRSSQKIKQFFLCRGYNKDLISKLSIRWWNQLPINEKQNLDTLKRIEHIGIQLKRPQIFTPVYLYQRWLIENSPEKFFRFELLSHRKKWLKVNSLLLNDSFIYTTLLESYEYLLHFFMSNKKLLNQMTKVLLKKSWLFENEIENIINETK
uniref:Protein Ycf2 n=1 Tax=Lunularia cruciata TaxID=56931 RepID=A0A8F2XVN1_9MARC|nr:hypothetical chloroplast RF21 [Lunularia cruciata]